MATPCGTVCCSLLVLSIHNCPFRALDSNLDQIAVSVLHAISCSMGEGLAVALSLKSAASLSFGQWLYCSDCILLAGSVLVFFANSVYTEASVVNQMGPDGVEWLLAVGQLAAAALLSVKIIYLEWWHGSRQGCTRQRCDVPTDVN